MEAIMEKVDFSTTRQNIETYLKTHDVRYVAEDAVFINLSTGEKHNGREAVGKMLNYIYHVAFDARADVQNYIITEDKAMFEGLFKGKHIGEFAGLQPTYKEVSVPLCVSYDLENGLIKTARIYMLVSVMMQQLKV
ncbi:MAG: ester cyclase [Chitinophagaceae bacterium]|nr:ester cyclase [Chitinophagaceae bacterium]